MIMVMFIVVVPIVLLPASKVTRSPFICSSVRQITQNNYERILTKYFRQRWRAAFLVTSD